MRVAIALTDAGELTINEICEQIKCSRSTYYRQVSPLLGTKTRQEKELVQNSECSHL